MSDDASQGAAQKYLDFWEPRLEKARENLLKGVGTEGYEERRQDVVRLEDSVNRVRGRLGQPPVGGGEYRNPPEDEPETTEVDDYDPDAAARKQRVLEAQQRYQRQRDEQRLGPRISHGLQMFWHLLVMAFVRLIEGLRSMDRAIIESIGHFFPPYDR